MEPIDPNENTPAAIAALLQHRFIADIDQVVVEDITIAPERLRRYERKVLLYRLASVLYALGDEEHRIPELVKVRKELDLLNMPHGPAREARKRAEICHALEDLHNLLSVDRTGTWASEWLLDVGVHETNPAKLTVFESYWFYFVEGSRKTVIELGMMLQEPE